MIAVNYGSDYPDVEKVMTNKDGKMSNSDADKMGGQSGSTGQDKESQRGQQQDSGGKGGQSTSTGQDKESQRNQQQDSGSKGGQGSGGNFANDPQKASEAGRKGGQNSHGGGRSH